MEQQMKCTAVQCSCRHCTVRQVGNYLPLGSVQFTVLLESSNISSCIGSTLFILNQITNLKGKRKEDRLGSVTSTFQDDFPNQSALLIKFGMILSQVTAGQNSERPKYSTILST